LSSLTSKRGNTDGAALFWIIPRKRDLNLLRLLVAYEIMADFLDTINERADFAGVANGQQLHLALVEAIDPDSPISDYYCHHPWQDDGGYLRALVEICRSCCGRLPSYPQVQAHLLRAARLAQVQALNHEPDPVRRRRILKDHARHELHDIYPLDWFELTAATSAWLAVLVLVALAAESTDECQAADTYDVYFWVCLAATMLDSYTDMDEDAANDSHSYVANYPSRAMATVRVRELLERATYEVGSLSRSHAHKLIVCCMTALYLSKDSARTPQMRANTSALARAGGSLTRLLLPILRAWRILYSQRSF
jgi:tetraprenyl-beta-curcumene synthase